MPSTADEIAANLRTQIQRGELQPGDRLPGIETLAERYSVNRQTARQALNQLKAEGLAESPGGRAGTIVRQRPTTRLVRSRNIERDHLGYYSGPTVQHWRTIQGLGLAIDTRPVPADVAELLGITPGTLVLLRERANGDPEQPQYRQLAASWFHPDIVEDVPVLAGGTGLGGSYDRIEEWAQQPLQWEEEVTAATPNPAEAETLLLPPGVPMLRILRVASLGRGSKARVVEVQDIRMSGELFSVRYPLQRRGAARWPVQPSTGDYYSAGSQP
ncbi:GntR family transcriptional regulator [Streptomyces sp. NPDC060011]|uniref:GntR family transcriptional regulator n=4 Tax=Actinomycetes TaxID=1760 RepID=A0ABW6GC51_9PSEU